MAKNGRLAGFGFEKLISLAGPLPEAVENLGGNPVKRILVKSKGAACHLTNNKWLIQDLSRKTPQNLIAGQRQNAS